MHKYARSINRTLSNSSFKRTANDSWNRETSCSRLSSSTSVLCILLRIDKHIPRATKPVSILGDGRIHSSNKHAFRATITSATEESSLFVRAYSTLSRNRLISIKRVSHISEREKVLTSRVKAVDNSIELFVTSDNSLLDGPPNIFPSRCDVFSRCAIIFN